MSIEQNQIFVGNIPFKSSEQEIRDLFSDFGSIVEVKIPTDRETKRPRGFAFVRFEDSNSAQQALSLNEKEFNGRPLVVNMAQSKKNA